MSNKHFRARRRQTAGSLTNNERMADTLLKFLDVLRDTRLLHIQIASRLAKAAILDDCQIRLYLVEIHCDFRAEFTN